MTDKLVNNGLVLKKSCNNDKRRTYIYLSDKAKILLKDIEKIHLELENNIIFRDISEENNKKFRERIR